MPALGFTVDPIERVRSDVIVVPLFAGERPLRGAAARVDWRLCGWLSHLFAADRLEGCSDEAVLIPGGGGIRAAHVLGLGAGDRAELDAARWRQWTAGALSRAVALAAQHAVIALPDSSGALSSRLDALLESASAASPEEITLAPEPADANGVETWLRATARRARSLGVELRPQPAARTPMGGQGRAHASRSSPEAAGRFTR